MSERGNSRIRVLVVDDHVLLREAFCALLNKEDDFEVVGWAGTPGGALKLARALQPDIVLLDIALGTTNGLDLAKELRRSTPITRIVAFASVEDENLLFDAMRIGVHSYLQKTLSVSEILSALRFVHQGEQAVGEPHAATQVPNGITRNTREQNFAHLGLSAKDIEIMRFASQGYSNREIGSRLFLSEIAVKRKMQDIYYKLQVGDRAKAVAEAIRLGLI